MKSQLTFKGGTAIKKMYVPEYRFSEDLDFTILISETTNDTLESAITSLFPWLKREANLVLAIRKVDVHSSGDPAFYLNYVGPLQGDITSRFLKVDFTRDEALVYSLKNLSVLSSYSDLENRKNAVQVYSLEEILAEKLRSLLTRTEPRDLYDVHYMLTNQLVDVEQLAYGMIPKFESKGFSVSDLKPILAKRQATFNQLWNGRLGRQMPRIPSLETVLRETNRFFQRYF